MVILPSICPNKFICGRSAPNPWRYLLERGRLADLLDHLAEKALRIVALAEEPLVELAQTPAALRVEHQRQAPEQRVDPAPSLKDP